jgi:hypothetical protein
MSSTRFSKNKMIVYLQNKQNEMEKAYGFDPNDGWDQVEGKGEKLNRLYGEYNQLESLIIAIEYGDI